VSLKVGLQSPGFHGLFGQRGTFVPGGRLFLEDFRRKKAGQLGQGQRAEESLESREKEAV